MNTRMLACFFVLMVGCISALACTFANQEDAVASVQDDELTTGPEDSEEVRKPGSIDEDASKEFTRTASGLEYRILRKSDGKKPTATQTVEVDYKGWLDDGKIFDSSYRRDDTISFGLNQVIKGWTEGVQLVGEGGMIELNIPYELGYGAYGTPGGPIPARARLHFIVELKSIK
ncbi:MAG: FKBP-type peptidyl-prolyl cis-trans isomerase [Pirellulaceae bacterium]